MTFYPIVTGLPSSVCVVGCAFIMAVSVYHTAKFAKLKPKFTSFNTEEYETKTHKIAAMVFWFVFLCLFWRFKARKSYVFKITVRLAQK